ncbi:hypothetical protein [Desulfonema ishimotonii]|uniref:hypothetical protein n=1 Tax=Desulfonema ishimotonii TaxID=45657 RepID=UPI000F57D5F0|nr:hypothetical protein [Desulfonema ishimotonii]
MGGQICTQCCGTRRLKEIDCPEDCFYLDKSKKYFFEREMKQIIGDEDRYLDVLQNIEFAIYGVYADKGNITDRHVQAAVEYLLEMGKARLGVPSEFLTQLPPNVQNVVDAIDGILEMRDEITEEREKLLDKLRCIYRIQDSVKFHYNTADECRYLGFIGQFLR